MKLLAISGSTRRNSTNKSLLRALAKVSPKGIRISMIEGLSDIPVFSPDSEGPNMPLAVQEFCDQLQRSDGVIIASPEYVRGIPGGLKKAIDWLVSREEIVNKPIVLAHASHRGDDMLQSLRLVLNTVTTRFDEMHNLRFSLMSKSPDEIRRILSEEEAVQRMRSFIEHFAEFVRAAKQIVDSGGNYWPRITVARSAASDMQWVWVLCLHH